MITQELTNFIKEQLSAGKSRIEISDMLIKNGWKASDVDEGFAAAAPSVAPVVAPTIQTAPLSMSEPVMRPTMAAQPVYNPANAAIANNNMGGMNTMASSMPDMVTASPQMAQVPPKKTWLKFVVGFFVVVVLAIAGYFGYGYYQEHYAVNPSMVAGKAFANLISANDFTFSGTSTTEQDQTIAVSGAVSAASQALDISMKNDSQSLDMETRIIGGVSYNKSVMPTGEFPSGQWISLKQGEGSIPEVFSGNFAETRKNLVAYFNAGKAITVSQQYPTEGSMSHYLVSLNSSINAAAGSNIALAIGSLTKKPFQVWIDTKTMTIMRIASTETTGGFDITISNINKGLTIEIPADAKTIEEVMGDMNATTDSVKTTPVATAVETPVDAIQSKAIAAKLRTILSNMRPQAELYWSNEGSGVYGTSNTKVGMCTGTGAGSMFTSVKGLKDLVSQMAQTLTSPTLYRCQSTGVRWAVSAKVGPAATDITCVDSSGYSGPVKLLTASDDAICE
jgi:hypothetical protein